MSEMNDDLLAEIDRTLKAELSVAPSADFEARVRRTIEERAPARSWWMPSYALLAAAAAVVIATTLAIVMMRPGVDEAAPLAARAGSDVYLAVERRAVGPEKPARSASARTLPQARFGETPRPRRHELTAGAHPGEPEVIVPLNQLDAVRRLVRDVNEGRISQIPSEPVAAASGPVDAAVAPLVVEPIIVPDAEVSAGISPVVRGF